MRKTGIGIAAAAALIAAGLPIHAQTSANNNAYLWGISNCRFIQVEVHQRQQNGGTVTDVLYTVKRCATGQTSPDETVVQGYATIPNADYRVGSQQHTLLTRVKDGVIQLTWKATADRQTSFSGQWVERDGSVSKHAKEDKFYSTARVEGSVAGFTVTPELSAQPQPAWVSSETRTER